MGKDANLHHTGDAASDERAANSAADAAIDLFGPAAVLAGKKIATAWQHLAESLAAHPDMWMQIVGEAQQKQMAMSAAMTSTMSATATSDKREDAAKTAPADNPFFAFLMQNYAIGGDTLIKIIDSAQVSDEDKKLLKFAARQYIAATSPANFPLTNPQVMAETAQSGGQNLIDGMRNFAEDMQTGMVSNTDKTAFAVGDNIANTAGAVIFQNSLMQLIEYAPQTAKVHARPLLIVPPCINKYYILDLQPHNSLVRHAVAAGHRVFLISWVNADSQHNHFRWDDYLRDGVMAALDTAAAISGGEKINALGFCIGGTLLCAALAALAESGVRPASSLTMLATMLDFGDTGEIGLFIDEEHVQAQERRFADGGLVDGADLARGFAALRPNDLIWPSFINNYYRGRKPSAFDLLYWNSDSVNLPGPMFAEYLRVCYLENQIAKGAAVFCDAPIDMAALALPTYVVACEKDHIVPWQAAFESARLLRGDIKFILSGGGHIAGIVNPPSAGKGWHMFLADSPRGKGKTRSQMDKTAAAWHKKARRCNGSWWGDWQQWLGKHGGKKINAPQKLGNTRFAKSEDAPGSYVQAAKPACGADEVANNAAALFGAAPFLFSGAGNAGKDKA